jgi:hypothetical protein
MTENVTLHASRAICASAQKPPSMLLPLGEPAFARSISADTAVRPTARLMLSLIDRRKRAADLGMSCTRISPLLFGKPLSGLSLRRQLVKRSKGE